VKRKFSATDMIFAGICKAFSQAIVLGGFATYKKIQHCQWNPTAISVAGQDAELFEASRSESNDAVDFRKIAGTVTLINRERAASMFL
jgi:hypothetical protein